MSEGHLIGRCLRARLRVITSRSCMKVVKLKNYYYPWDLGQAIKDIVNNYNNHGCHDSSDNPMPADVYFGRVEEVKNRREWIKEITLQMMRV